MFDYLATHPDAKIRYWQSDTILLIHSDASFLVERDAKSNYGGYFYLGWNQNNDEPQKINGAVNVSSFLLPLVVILHALMYHRIDPQICCILFIPFSSRREDSSGEGGAGVVHVDFAGGAGCGESCGIFGWVELSLPEYIDKILARFRHPQPKKTTRLPTSSSAKKITRMTPAPPSPDESPRLD